jgi:hypothetical protein
MASPPSRVSLSSPHGRLYNLSLTPSNTPSASHPLSLSPVFECRQPTPVAVVDAEAVAEAKDPQVIVPVAMVPRLLSIEPESLEEYAPFFGPLEPAIVGSTVRSSTKQSLLSSLRRRPPHNPQITPPTFFPLRA